MLPSTANNSKAIPSNALNFWSSLKLPLSSARRQNDASGVRNNPHGILAPELDRRCGSVGGWWLVGACVHELAVYVRDCIANRPACTRPIELVSTGRWSRVSHHSRLSMHTHTYGWQWWLESAAWTFSRSLAQRTRGGPPPWSIAAVCVVCPCCMAGSTIRFLASAASPAPSSSSLCAFAASKATDSRAAVDQVTKTCTTL
jgi:hypothetical protein